LTTSLAFLERPPKKSVQLKMAARALASP